MLGQAPVSDDASIFGRAGLYLWDAEFLIETVSFGAMSKTDDGNDPFFGFGANFDIGERMAVKLEYDFYEASDGDIDFLGTGLDFRF